MILTLSGMACSLRNCSLLPCPIDLVEGHLVGEAQVGVACQSFVHVAHAVAGIALAVGKDYLHLGVVEQQANEFAARIACRTKYSNINHFVRKEIRIIRIIFSERMF